VALVCTRTVDIQLTNSPIVSVIMTVYNGQPYIAEAIESALAQTYRNLELIIVDDCSPDHSEDVIRQYLGDKRLVLVRNDSNAGVAASRNRGLAIAKGEYITFLDQDDVWLPHKLELQVAAILSHPDIGLLHAGYARIDEKGDFLPAYKDLATDKFANPGADVVVRDVFSEIFISNDIQPLTTMIPKAVLEAVGHFDSQLPGVDDYELWLRIAYKYPVGHLDTIVGYWRAHSGQQSNLGYKMLMLRLQALDLILARFPQAKQRVPAKDFRKRMGGMCRSAANYTMYYLHEYSLARPLFLRAVTYRPFDLNSFAKWAYCSSPTMLREAVKASVRMVKRSVKEQGNR
jgi:glycosyltransferase involved in cell wall biosynthesis